MRPLEDQLEDKFFKVWFRWYEKYAPDIAQKDHLKFEQKQWKLWILMSFLKTIL